MLDIADDSYDLELCRPEQKAAAQRAPIGKKAPDKCLIDDARTDCARGGAIAAVQQATLFEGDSHRLEIPRADAPKIRLETLIRGQRGPVLDQESRALILGAQGKDRGDGCA